MNYPGFTSQNKVSDFVNKNPDHAIDYFNNLGIDFCCGGAKTLKQACEEKKLDHEQILSQLNDPSKISKKDNCKDWTQLTPAKLTDHIVSSHHKYLSEALPRVTEAMEKVVRAHGKNHPELLELEKNIRLLREDLEPHMLKEEKVLFPMIRKMEGNLEGGMPLSRLVANPIRVMRSEHDKVAELLQNIKTLTNNYTPPEDACGTFTFLYQKLKELESDTHLHVHKENNLLFPQALNEVNQG
jgi:regulator of cell morphogenesis and NO signaling